MKRNLLFLLCLFTFFTSTAFRYTRVAESSCPNVFPAKMNVFYIGVDNPVSVSACGIASDLLVLNISGGTMSGARGEYTVRVPAGTEAIINVGAKDEGGLAKPLGSYKFRIKRVPDPVCYVGNIKGDGIMSKAEVANIRAIFPRMENFDFDVSFQVVSFDLTTLANGKYETYKSTGREVTAEMSSALASARPGDRLLFENVVVKGPDASIRKIPGVIIKVR